jgi:predicted HTH domain antitoxin
MPGVSLAKLPCTYNEGAVRIEVDIPVSEETLDAGAKDRLRRDLLETAVLRLFDERRISSAEAALELGLTRVQFMELARKRGVPQYDYTAADLTADLADLEAIEHKLPPPASAR